MVEHHELCDEHISTVQDVLEPWGHGLKKKRLRSATIEACHQWDEGMARLLRLEVCVPRGEELTSGLYRGIRLADLRRMVFRQHHERCGL